MRILYGIQGTGNGHISRSTQIIHHLKMAGAQVDVIFSGCDPTKVFDKTTITSYAFFKGFTFHHRNGAVDLFRTVRNLSPVRFTKDFLTIDARNYDLVITDFEPLTAMIARKNRLPSIGIGHQYAFLYDIPVDRAPAMDRLIMRYFAPADHAIGLHWHHFNQPILPPVINSSVQRTGCPDDRLILVYLPFEDQAAINGFLRDYTGFRFHVYAGHKTETTESHGHIVWHGFSRTGFYRDLSACAGVICNAGFELPSEALYLGKKLLVKPLSGQFEQSSNALAIRKLNIGATMRHLDKKTLEHWLADSGTAPHPYPDVARRIAGWITEERFSDIRALVDETWN